MSLHGRLLRPCHSRPPREDDDIRETKTGYTDHTSRQTGGNWSNPFLLSFAGRRGETVYHLRSIICISRPCLCLVVSSVSGPAGRCLQIVGISSVCVSFPVFCFRHFIPVFTSCLPCLCPVPGRSISCRVLVMSRSSSFCALGSAQDKHVSQVSVAYRASNITYCAARRRTPLRFARRLGRSFAAAASWV